MLEKILEIWNKAIYVGEMYNSIYKPWHFPWTDRVNIEVQKAPTPQITADQCDVLIAAIRKYRKARLCGLRRADFRCQICRRADASLPLGPL